MKQRVVPGAEIEAATPQEVGALVAELLGATGRPQRPVRAEASKAADTSGNVRCPVYTVPAGMGFRLTRVYVTIDSATFGAPFTGSGAYLLILRNDVPVDGIPLTPGSGFSLPAVLTTGITDAAYFENGDELAVQAFNLTASIGLLVRMQGELVASAPPDGKGGRGGG